MNISVLIADDSIIDCEQISTQLNDWACRTSCHLDIDITQQLSQNNVADVYKYDILFLDIELPSMSGMDFAKMVRQYNEQIPIAFFTSHDEFAVDGYDVQAMSYILKPSSQVNINRCMDRLFKEKLEHVPSKIIIKSNQIDMYDDDEVVYIEAVGHYTNLYTLTNCKTYHLPFKELNNLLPKPPFFNCYRSYTVNLNYVYGVKNQEVVLIDNKKVLLSKNCMIEFKNSLLQLHKGV